ncbi:MAG TPA: hypothetical protein VFF65_00365 [Phycisphaerales bacterium]|nr:hypothetical protein [Phycisphaerales bacterium]
MRANLHRRDLLATAPAAGLALLGLGGAVRAQTAEPAKPAPAAWPNFPHQDPALVRGLVGAAHRDEARVRDLIDAHPALVNAAWDWGFGDWETPLGAAAHTGRRNIAELLISRGARVDLFAAAMLGWTDTVKAATAASPGVQRALGPHGLTLLHHARAGEAAAEGVVAHLEALGNADTRPSSMPLAESARAQYEGTFAYGAAPGERFTVRSAKQGMEFVHGEKGPIRLTMVTDGEFTPAGAPAVRFRFSVRDGTAQRAVITDHDLIVTGVRAG